MRITKVRMLFATVAALALMVGVGSAIAASGGGGNGLKGVAAHITGKANFEASVAKNLGTTTAKLDAAVAAAAKANIAASLAAGDITAAEAETLNDALAEGTIPAMRLATAAGVAKELDTTVAKLNAAFSSAAKTQATARVDQALKDGKITATAAAEMKAKIAEATFPGFGAGGPGHHGGPGGHGAPHDGMGGPGGGKGFGPPPGAAPEQGSSSSTTPAALVFA